mgnify:CR=1 FL=1
MVSAGRLRERFETDQSDVELQAIIDGINAEIDGLYGPIAPISVRLDGKRRWFLTLHRGIDTGASVTISEREDSHAGAASGSVTLSADDYEVLDRGRTIERLKDGTHGRTWWAPVVSVSYTPLSDRESRDEAIIQIATIDLQRRGLTSENAGDWSAQYGDLVSERDRVLRSLAPRGRMMMA